jgi:hypothetical protein
VERARRLAGRVSVIWRLVRSNPNACVFLCGLAAVCGSIAQWSGPLAGVVFGGVLMGIAVWPYLAMRKG